jgi:hypothetical protein
MRDEAVGPAENAYLADRAVTELIADAESGRIRIKHNRELAEVIMGCIRETAPKQLETLKRLLNQRALEHPHPD